MKENIETYIVDSFTNEPFKGNPAGVCIIEHELDEKEMQSIAKELGLSETAFIMTEESTDKFSIRYFSPKMEIPLCGHATLASSKVIFELHPELLQISFRTIEELSLEITKKGSLIEMIFPIYNTEYQVAPQTLLKALGIDAIINSEYNEETKILLLEIESNEKLRKLSPNFEALKQSHDSINGVLVTSKSNRGNYDFESRYFWPWSGTNEDPVTGGTHTFLAKYWSTRLNKSKMNSFQCSERTGFMEVELLDEKTMSIKSEAQIILRGSMQIG